MPVPLCGKVCLSCDPGGVEGAELGGGAGVSGSGSRFRSMWGRPVKGEVFSTESAA